MSSSDTCADSTILPLRKPFCVPKRRHGNAACPVLRVGLDAGTMSTSGRIVLAGVGKPRRRVRRTPEPKHPAEPDRQIPTLPSDLLAVVFRDLEVKDLCNCSCVAKEWQRIVYTRPEAGFQRCFLRDYGAAATAEHAGRPTWRDRYIAKAIDKASAAMRDKASYLDELEDTSAALERSVQNTLTKLNQLDRTVSHRRWDLNKLLGDVAGRSIARHDSGLGRDILQAARALAAAKPAAASGGGVQGSVNGEAVGEQCSSVAGPESNPPSLSGALSGGGSCGSTASTSSSSSDEAAAGWPNQQLYEGAWRARLSPELATQLVEMAGDVAFWLTRLRRHKEELKAQMDALATVSDSIKGLRATLAELRRRKAALEAATTYRHSMRRA